MNDKILSPVPAIVQHQQRTWDQMIQLLGKLSMEEDKTALDMGDLLLEIEEKFGKTQVQEAAEQVQIGKQVVKQRMRVARRIPKGHPLRKQNLTWSHLRELSKLEDDGMLKWAQDTVKNQWPVARLMRELEASGDQQAQDEGSPCIQCEKPLPANGEIVSFTIGHQKRARCCGVDCALEYFRELRQEQMEETEPLDSISGELDLADLPPLKIEDNVFN